MRKLFRFTMIVAIAALTMASCKSKQKVTEISGAFKPATEVKSETTAQPAAKTETLQEVTRNESFKLADGETNSGALNKKYHVVVGSFGIQSNATGLRNTLNNEGNPALIVINEKGMYRVLIDSFDDYKAAHDKIDSIKGRFPDAWVLVQK